MRFDGGILISYRFSSCPFDVLCGKFSILCQLLYILSDPGTGGKVRCTLSWSVPVHPY